MFRVRIRLVGRLLLAALLSLSACGGNYHAPPGASGTPSGSGNYTIGGTVSGLPANATLVLQNNGANATTITATGTFTFSGGLAAGAAYAVTVLTQPTGVNCTVAGGVGTVVTSNVTGLVVNCVAIGWTWQAGSSLAAAPGVYGTLRTTAAGAVPGARSQATSWLDGTGNLWVFGGVGCDSSPSCSGAPLNDLWQYTTVGTGSWTWISGSNLASATAVYGVQGSASSNNVPGARVGAASWSGSAGKLWLFGGNGLDAHGATGNLNDLWQFDTNTKTWTWIAGASTQGALGVYGTQGAGAAANAPGARSGAASWTDASGNLWLFGGFGCDAASACTGATGNWLNDLWKYTPGTGTIAGTWTWVGGSNLAKAPGVYGVRATAAAANVPGARRSAAAQTDASGRFWLFGGIGCDASSSCSSGGYLNDLWVFDPAVGTWTWIGGASSAGAAAVYGTLGTAAAANAPGARAAPILWSDPAGSLWLFGGSARSGGAVVDSYMSDLWRFDPVAATWMWVGGANTANGAGIYGAIGQAGSGYLPGARAASLYWADAAGNLWLFGGLGCDASVVCATAAALNDLWLFAP